ncbi:DUF1150 family protein [Rhodopila sp.]|uniref:DUF1150 family protein n=1 Tax=Rhodopila sp. TaxID=2480087 RepID=UPI002CFE233C|nr:DUF1150 family protein [Rhodopila sp.]HVZ09060.1 DUF1150 family protein [Rhodopila sp.]
MNAGSGDRSEMDMAPATEIGTFDIRHLSEAQLAALGVSQIAYVKPIIVNGQAGFAIHAADGTPMAVAGDRNVAVAAILQHEMQPLSVH